MRVITIGRGPENDIVIQDPKVSKIHLQLVSNGNICSAVDLNSTNGTYVNGKIISGEVCLQPNDTIRIGDTMLPWQTYINNSIESTGGESGGKPNIPPHNNKKLWIIIAISALIILGGVAFGIYHYQNQKEKERIEEEYKKEQARLEEEVRQKEEERKKEEKEQDDYKNALRKDRDANKKLADDKADEAKKAKEAAKKAQKDADEANAVAVEAKKEASSANAKAKEADEAKKQAQEDATNAKEAEQKAKEAEQKAKDEASAAKKSEELTAQFYEEYSTMKQDFAKQVCTRLGKEITKDTGDAKNVLKGIFTQSDNKGKQAVINAIMYVKQNPRGEKNNSEGKDTTAVKSAPKDTSSTK